MVSKGWTVVGGAVVVGVSLVIAAVSDVSGRHAGSGHQRFPARTAEHRMHIEVEVIPPDPWTRRARTTEVRSGVRGRDLYCGYQRFLTGTEATRQDARCFRHKLTIAAFVDQGDSTRFDEVAQVV